jgi:hypothetical protein
MYQVRDGKQVVPTCPECGCRLKLYRDDLYWHYRVDGQPWRDAKGHDCTYKFATLKLLDRQFYVNNSTNWKVPEREWQPA